jgi:hypothetical protein
MNAARPKSRSAQRSGKSRSGRTRTVVIIAAALIFVLLLLMRMAEFAGHRVRH